MKMMDEHDVTMATSGVAYVWWNGIEKDIGDATWNATDATTRGAAWDATWYLMVLGAEPMTEAMRRFLIQRAIFENGEGE